MASAAHEQLLCRYLQAAQALAALSPREQGMATGKPPTHDVRADGPSRHPSDNLKNKQDEPDEPDPAATALTQLLGRQASGLIKIHKSLASGNNDARGVDEELLQRRIQDLISISSSKFYSYRYDLLPAIWRQIYADALILDTFRLLLRPLITIQPLPEDTLDTAVEKLDRAIITAGGGGRGQWLEKTLQILEESWERSQQLEHQRPVKRQRRDGSPTRNFSIAEPYGRPKLSPENECPRHSGWTMEQFEEYMNSDDGEPRPVVFTDLIRDWPALTDRPWKKPEYLLSRTFGGRRVVPVEVGRSYVDDDWGQELIPFREFLARYVEVDPSTTTTSSTTAPPSQPTGYLAQHNLFQQIPSLRNDIRVPDLCWIDVPPHPTTPSLNQPPLDVPQLNAWFGPARTITPLHTDGYHNLLCQAVGAKYLRLYPPRATPVMQPRAPEHGVDMSNTSGIDVGVLEGWDERPEGVGDEDIRRMKEELEGVEYWECVLEPGDTLVIPIGWWHYVRSLSVSFSVSFWWN